MTAPCRALIGGFGRPGMRDLDFGRQIIDYLQHLEWPEGVVIEDLSCSAPLVLHRLQELRPAKVVFVGAVGRDLDPPATLRRYRVDLAPLDGPRVQRSVEESVMGLVDIDHTLAMARHWGALPVDTVVIEVEPAEVSFGLGFSEELGGCLDAVVDKIRDELVDVADGAGQAPEVTVDDFAARGSGRTRAVQVDETAGPSEALNDLLTYSRDHAQARLQVHRAPALVDGVRSGIPGVVFAGHVRPWGVFVDRGSDWFDVVPLEAGMVGIVIGNVPGRGVEAASAMSDLRAAVRASVVVDGTSPFRLLGHLDRLAQATGTGHQARLLYLTLRPATGELRYANAGSCPPLLLNDGVPDGCFLEATGGAPVGAPSAERQERAVYLTSGATLLLFSDGLVQSRTVPRDVGMDRLRRAASEGRDELDTLCEHVLATCSADLRRDDDICLLGVRLLASSTSAPTERAPRCVH
ncbi:MAG: SpoIIE family protein phosphatase [Actinomycetota bacterium]|nr:SpoIIE family protein phosphatase [Actinomycetota bacterium]